MIDGLTGSLLDDKVYFAKFLLPSLHPVVVRVQGILHGLILVITDQETGFAMTIALHLDAKEVHGLLTVAMLELLPALIICI